jgi:hypothetical protein
MSYDESRAVLSLVESGVSMDDAVATVLAAQRPAITPSVGGARNSQEVRHPQLSARAARAVLSTPRITVAFLAHGTLHAADGGAAATTGGPSDGLCGCARTDGAERAAVPLGSDRA